MCSVEDSFGEERMTCALKHILLAAGLIVGGIVLAILMVA